MLKGLIFFILFAILTLGQICVGFVYHSSLIQMSLAASIFLTVSLTDSIIKSKYYTLLIRAASLIIYIAMLFINTSHCFESLTHLFWSANHHEQNSSIILSHYFLIFIAFDLLLKCIYCAFHKTTLATSNIKAFIMTLSPTFFFIATMVYKHFLHGVLNDYLLNMQEPIMAIVLTILSYTIIFPSFVSLKPYLLADNPPTEMFNISDIHENLVKEFPSLRKFSHIHANVLWPSGYKATMNVDFKVYKSDPSWIMHSAESFEVFKQRLQSITNNTGTNKIIVEPSFSDPSENSDHKLKFICIDPNCHLKDVGCCTVRKRDPPLPRPVV